jgi:hypothetical protein
MAYRCFRLADEYDFGTRISSIECINNKGKAGTIVFAVCEGIKGGSNILRLFVSGESESSGFSEETSEAYTGGYVAGIFEDTAVSGDTLIGYLVCSVNQTLSRDFLKDYKSHTGELKDIDTAYLLMCRFTDEIKD